jgi:acyl carrier protein
VSNVESVVRSILVGELRVDGELVTREAPIHELPGMASLKYVNALAAIEKAYDVHLDYDAFFDVETVGDLIDLVHQQVER